MRRVALFICIADLLIAIAGVHATLFGAREPATSAMDEGAGVAILVLLALTALPSAIRLWQRASARWALGLALAFPGLIIVLIALAAILIA
jgi:hypothetical protein